MMTVTNNVDNDLLTITSDLIDDYVTVLPSKPWTLALTVKVNCETEFTFTLDDSTIDLINSEFTLLPADFNQDTVFDNQVISFSLLKTTVSTGATEVQTYCLFIDKDLKCQVIDFIGATISSNESTDDILLVQSLYSSLLNVNDCSDCDCEDGCIIFEYLTSLLGGTTTTTSNCANCN